MTNFVKLCTSMVRFVLEGETFNVPGKHLGAWDQAHPRGFSVRTKHSNDVFVFFLPFKIGSLLNTYLGGSNLLMRGASTLAWDILSSNM